jgi:hypothetical protein
MTDPLVLGLFLATWGGMLWIFRRLADEFGRTAVRSSHQVANAEPGAVPAPVAAVSGGEDLARLAAELQQTTDALDSALARRTGRLNDLMAEADQKIAALASATASAVSDGNTTAKAQQPLPPADLGRPLSAGDRATIEEVRRLASQGHDPDTIARVTNRGREEVRLLLGRTQPAA